MPSPRLLAIKLADIGDVLLTTPALRRLRAAYPTARLDFLTTVNGAAALMHSTLIDETLLFDKGDYDRLGDAARPAALLSVVDFGRQLHARRYDIVLLFHHLTTLWGAAKFNGLLWATGAPLRVGLDNGRGLALTHRIPDEGFGAQHEAAYALAVAQLAIAVEPTPLPPFPGREGGEVGSVPPPFLGEGRGEGFTLDFPIPAEAHAAAERLLAPLNAQRSALSAQHSVPQRVALFPGSGAYSLARRWPPELFAQVADALQHRGVQVVLIGRSGDNTSQVAAAMQTRPALDLTDRGDLRTLGAVLHRMDLLLTNDGGPMHIASAVGTPVVAVFGLSNDAAFGPWDGGHAPQLWPPRLDQPKSASRHTVVKLGLGCQPCFYRGHRLGAVQGCATRECLTMLPPAMVLKAVLARLKTKD